MDFATQGDNGARPVFATWVDTPCDPSVINLLLHLAPTVWIQATGCFGGLTNQKLGISRLLAALEVAVPKLPQELAVVLVAPRVLLAVEPPLAIDANGNRY